MGYLPRLVEKDIATRLNGLGAVVLEGPRASGKTETARQFSKSEVLLDVNREAREAALLDPTLILGGQIPRLFDEWQLVPGLWNATRREVDRRQTPGQFLLTGSVVIPGEEDRHPGTGRIGRVHMRPMSLFESGHSSGEISLAALMNKETPRSIDVGLTVRLVSERIAIGGWPPFLERSVPDALAGVRDYLDEVRDIDIRSVGGVRRDPSRIARLFRSLARNVATTAAVTTLVRDISDDEEPLSRHTVTDYLDALARVWIVEDQPAWSPHLRSRSIVRSSPKRHFVDPSLAVAALGASPDRLLADLNLFGYLFESMVIRDLRIYAQTIDATVMHYTDNTVEADAIVESRDGKWGAFEIKIRTGEIDKGAASLLRFARKIDTSKCGEPAILGVIVATGYGYVRPDSVAVIPIGSLGP